MTRVHRRGLTLLETLLASAILAMMAGTCVPMLSTSLRALNSDTLGDAKADELQVELGALADAYMLNPEKFGCKELAKTIQQSDLNVPWPPAHDAPSVDRPNIVIHALPPSGEHPDHLWLTFHCDGQSVVRYLALPKPKQGSAP